MRVAADMSTCQAYGNCAQEAPEVFGLDEWGYVELPAGGVVPSEKEESARRGIAACPVRALSIVD